jgi:hypothetical protein
VAVTCSVSGTSLTWEAREGDNTSLTVQIANFHQGHSVGHGFSNSRLFNCHGRITFNSTLVNSSSDSNHVLKSSMTVTPVSSNAQSHCAPITITCKALDSQAKNKTIYQIAGESLLLYTLINSYPHHSLSGSSGNCSLLLNHYAIVRVWFHGTAK